MLYDSLIRRSILASILCLFFASALFSQYSSNDRSVGKRTVPAFKPPQSPTRSNASKSGVVEKKPELLLEPIIIHYPRRLQQPATAGVAEKKPVEIIKPITIYYRVWAPRAIVSTPGSPTGAQSKAPTVAKLPMRERIAGGVKATGSVTAKVPESKPVEAPSAPLDEPSPAEAPNLSPPALPGLSEVAIALTPVPVEEKPAPIDPPKPPDETSTLIDPSSKPAEDKAVSVNLEKPAEESASTTAASEPSNTSATVASPAAQPAEAGAAPAPVAPSNVEIVEPNTEPADTDKTVPAITEKLGTDSVALNNAAVNLSLTSRHEEAEQLLLRAIQADPNSYKFHRNLSIVYEGMKKFDEALASANKAVELAPDDNSVMQQLCKLKFVTGKKDAVMCFEKLFEAMPQDTLTQTLYGVVLLRAGRADKAIPILQKAATTTPPNGATLNALGVAYFETKRFVDAIDAFKSAVEADPDKHEIRFNLAVAQFSNGNREGAISQYRILKNDDPKLAGELFEMLFRDKVLRADRD